MNPPPPNRSLWRRMIRASLLEADLYEEVEAEHRSIGQAFLVVLLATAAGGLGSALGGHGVRHIAIDVMEPFVLWLAGSVFSYMVGATFLRGPETVTDYAEVLRTTGFAFSPGIFRVLAAVPPPPLGFAFTVATDLWMLVAGIIAVRQALDFTTLRAIATFGVSYLLLWLTLSGLLISLPL
jgi:hypothetical protein